MPLLLLSFIHLLWREEVYASHPSTSGCGANEMSSICTECTWELGAKKDICVLGVRSLAHPNQVWKMKLMRPHQHTHIRIEWIWDGVKWNALIHSNFPPSPRIERVEHALAKMLSWILNRREKGLRLFTELKWTQTVECHSNCNWQWATRVTFTRIDICPIQWLPTLCTYVVAAKRLRRSTDQRRWILLMVVSQSKKLIKMRTQNYCNIFRLSPHHPLPFSTERALWQSNGNCHCCVYGKLRLWVQTKIQKIEYTPSAYVNIRKNIFSGEKQRKEEKIMKDVGCMCVCGPMNSSNKN